MAFKNGQWHNLQRGVMGGRQIDLGGTALVMRLQEAGRAKTPVIPRLQPGKAKLGPWRRQVVANIFRIGQKFGCHDGADRVTALILGACVTVTVAKEPGQRDL